MPTSVIQNFEALKDAKHALLEQLAVASEHQQQIQSRVQAAELLKGTGLLNEDAFERLTTDVAQSTNNYEQLNKDLLDLEVKLSAAQQSVGTEFLDILRDMGSAIDDLLRDPDIRGNNELRAIVIDDLTEQLKEATLLNTLLVSLTTPATPADDSPPPAQELVIDVGLPAELSEYVLNDKSGYGLKAFATRYTKELQCLVNTAKGDIPQVTEYLKKRGLNGGLLSTSVVEGMFRNAGIRIIRRKYVITSPNGVEVAAGSAIDATRLYMQDILGLDQIYEHGQKAFNRGFYVRNDSAGAYALHLHGHNIDKLKELLRKISRHLKIQEPQWTHVDC